MLNICIVLPSYLGDVTPYDYVRRILPQDAGFEYECTVISASRIEKEHQSCIVSPKIKYVNVESCEYNAPLSPDTEFTRAAYAIYQHLLAHRFDRIYFDVRGGLGFYTVQAKRTTDSFDSSTIIANLDSNSQWFCDCNEEWNKNPVQDAYVWYAERYCARYADMLISPTHYMLAWAKKNNWDLCENQRIISYSLAETTNVYSQEINFKHLVFWGNMRVNSGVELFCKFVSDLGKDEVSKVTFIGKDDWMYGFTPSQYIRNHFKDMGIPCDVLIEWDAQKALALVKPLNGLIVIPHQYANYSWQAALCQANDIPFITSSVGGSAELFPKDRLFDLNTSSMVERYRFFKAGNASHTMESVKDAATPSDVFLWRTEPQNDFVRQRIDKEKPLVSICIAHYNHHKFLPATLKSIAMTNYDNYEVVIIDDGSSLPESLRVFDDLAVQYDKPNWHFYKKQNEHLGKTRNYSVGKASGKYVIFVDADNLAKPNMVSDFLFGIYKSGADCLTCHIDTFLGEDEPSDHTKTAGIMMPMGPILEIGCMENIFGDANFIVKKEAYIAAGGFPEERLSLDDWCFLMKLGVAGFTQDVIPRLLYKYRVLENSMVHTGNNYKSQKRIIHAFNEGLPPSYRFMVESMVLPLYQGAVPSVPIPYIRLKKALETFFPSSSFRRRILMKIARILRLL